MQNPKPFREPPRYPVESVDHALALLEMVRDFGRVRISVAAQMLDISRSTAHRLMAMLVYRGYVEQDDSRRYVPGPAMGLTPTGLSWTAELRHRARPHLERLAERVKETANLMVLSGDAVRFLLSQEPSQNGKSPSTAGHSESLGQLRIGDRRGVVLPVGKTAGGKAMLAAMSEQRVLELINQAMSDGTRKGSPQTASLLNELAVIRARGFATNYEDTEAGVNAAGVAILDGQQEVIAGLSVSIPPQRFGAAVDTGLIDALQSTKTAFEAELGDFVADR